jgi:hypothetical protein
VHRCKKHVSLFALVVFVLNAFLWTFNVEAFAGGLVHHEESVTSSAVLDDAAQGSPDAGEQTACNHGCHMMQHLLGQICTGPEFTHPPLSDQLRSDHVRGQPQPNSRAQERPPRFSFKA